MKAGIYNYIVNSDNKELLPSGFVVSNLGTTALQTTHILHSQGLCFCPLGMLPKGGLEQLELVSVTKGAAKTEGSDGRASLTAVGASAKESPEPWEQQQAARGRGESVTRSTQRVGIPRRSRQAVPRNLSFLHIPAPAALSFPVSRAYTVFHDCL